jgi:hypothetical protein
MTSADNTVKKMISTYNRSKQITAPVFGSGFAIFQQGSAARRRTSRASVKSAEKQKNLLLDTPGQDRLI